MTSVKRSVAMLALGFALVLGLARVSAAHPGRSPAGANQAAQSAAYGKPAATAQEARPIDGSAAPADDSDPEPGTPAFPLPKISVIELHMAAAHFPIALLMSSVFFDVVGFLFRRRQLRDTAYWTHLLGVVAAVVTMILGFLGNPFSGSEGEFVAATLRHQWMGVSSLVVFALMALWRVRARNEFAGMGRVAFLGAAFAGVAVVGVTGYLGAYIMG